MQHSRWKRDLIGLAAGLALAAASAPAAVHQVDHHGATDNDRGSLIVLDAPADRTQQFVIDGDPVTVFEGDPPALATRGKYGVFLVALAEDPLGPVEVTVAHHDGDTDIIVLFGATLTFDSTNYDAFQPVVLAALEDADYTNGTATIRVSATGIDPADVTAIEQDNDPVPPVVYVDAVAGGADDGTSWTDAFTDLQDGLYAAGHTGGGVEEVWVAAAVYRPAGPGGARTATFPLVSGVAVYGGFPPGGGDGTFEARAPATYVTILSGDLNSDDGPGPFENNAENSYHVVTGSGTDVSAILDGFTVTAGNANDTENHNAGGGMYNKSGSPTLSNCLFSANWAYYGAGVYDRDSSNPMLTDCTFSGNAADYAGGMRNFYSSNPTLTNCDFNANSATHGGGMHNVDSSPELISCTFTANSADQGGGMGNQNSSPELTDCTFTGNTANLYSGGAMTNGDQSNPTLTNCSFANNSAQQCGGGMNNWLSSPTLAGCTFTNNWTVLDSGGGMANGGGSSPELISCTFTGNSADLGGGMENWDNSSPVLTGCTFTNNWTVLYSGGGMANGGASRPTLTNCAFADNTARESGGAMANWDNSGPALSGCSFTGNAAELYTGGAMTNGDDSNAELNNCTFADNTAQHYGGAMDNWQSSPRLTDCSFNENSALAYSGGAINNAEFSSPVLKRCTFHGNEATEHGGAVANWWECNARLSGCTFIGNMVGSNGAGLHNSNNSPTLRNCIFSGNQADDDGGAVACESSAAMLTNCTLAGNSAGVRGGGMRLTSSSATLTNCILWNNSDVGGTDQDSQVFGDSPVINYCCVQGWTGALGGVGNLGDDPLFADADGPDDIVGTEDDDLHLLPDSPCANTGSSAAAVVFSDVTTAAGTNSTIIVADAGGYAVNDEIEYDADHVLRTVTDVDPTTNTVTFDDPIAAPSEAARNVANYGWGDMDGEDRIQYCRVDMGPDETPYFNDCNSNGTADACDTAYGTSEDCNFNEIPDECEPDQDCNFNGVQDICDIAGGTSQDCNGNVVPDECDLTAGTSQDCNANEVPDECDIAGDTSNDVNNNDIPDECEDCNGNQYPDEEENAVVVFQNYGVITGELDTTAPVAQDLRLGGGALLRQLTVSYRSTGSSPGTMMLRFFEGGPGGSVAPVYPEGLIEEYNLGQLLWTAGDPAYKTVDVEPALWLPSDLWLEVEIEQDAGMILRSEASDTGFTRGLVYDRRAGEMLPGPLYMSLRLVGVQCSSDCNANQIADACDIDCGPAEGDCDVPGCGQSADCNGNAIPDECDLAEGISENCNDNDIPDECDIAEGTSPDDNGNDVPDECEVPPCLCGDIDESGGLVDLNDFATFAFCFGLNAPSPPDCDAKAFECSDLDGDLLVDLRDFTTFALWFGLESSQTVPDCTPE